MENEIYRLYLTKLLLLTNNNNKNKEIKEITNWIENKRKEKNSFIFFISFFNFSSSSLNLNKNELILTSQNLLYVCKSLQKQDKYNQNEYSNYLNQLFLLLFQLKYENNKNNNSYKIIINNIYLCLSCLIIHIKNNNENDDIMNILLQHSNNCLKYQNQNESDNNDNNNKITIDDIIEILIKIPELVLSNNLYSGDKETINNSLINLSSIIFQELPNILEFFDINISIDLIFDMNNLLPQQYLSLILTFISEWLNISITLFSEYHICVPFYDANTFLSSRYILIINEGLKYLSKQNIILTDEQKDLFNSISDVLLNLLKLKWLNENDQSLVISMVF